MDYLDETRVSLIYQLPLCEIIYDYFDTLKSATRGYASLDYELSGYQASPMGILKHYEVINPFVSATTDSLNRLKPGFEAPVCIVTALGGETPDVPTRNRTVLAGLIRDMYNPKATRFEVRAPNPFSNTYLILALFYLAALDGIRYAVGQEKEPAELLAEISKSAGESADYLEKDRAYRSEIDVFENFSDEERSRMKAVKKALDPKNLMNPGKVVDIAGFEGLK